MEQRNSESIFENINNSNMLMEFHDAIEDLPFVNVSHAIDSDQFLSGSEHDSSIDGESTVHVLSEHTPDSPASLSSSGLRRRRPHASHAIDSDQFLSGSEHDSSIDGESTVHVLSEHTPDSPASLSSSGLRRRRPASHRSSEDFSQSQFFINNPDGLIDFDRRSLTGSQRKKYRRSWSDRTGSQSVGRDGSQLQSDITSIGSNGAITSVGSNGAITRVGSNGRRPDDESITSNSKNSSSILLLTLAELLLKALRFQNQLFANSLTFPIWLMKLSLILVADPLSITYQWIEKHKFSWNSCIPTAHGHGLLYLAYCCFILASFIALPFLLSGTIMKWIVSPPAQITEELIFDYTRDTPMAYVPIISCSNSSHPGLIEKSNIGATESQILQFDREVQATVSLTLPESDYNRNLGVFQVRVDFLSGDGKLLATIRQPSMFPFKSKPIRLLCTLLNLAPVLAGYSSETQTLDITFKGYTEKNVPTSCLRVVLEHRAEFAEGGGLPEIYAASLTLESRHPYWKRVLWYWKRVIFMGMTSMMFTVELMFMLLRSQIVFPRRRRVGVSLDNGN
ncbi:hypothetical protein LXL04_027432 [Taraxacum kok-saghyz]